MGTPRRPEAEWQSNGFPPRSFSREGPALQVAAPPPPPRRGRGRWLAAAAIAIAVLLLAVGLLVATRRQGGSRVATGATSTTAGSADTAPPPLGSDTSIPDTVSSLDPVGAATPVDPGTTSGGTTGGSIGTAPGTTVPVGAPGPGVLDASPTTLVLPRTDATLGVSRANLTLRNVGASPVSYTTQSSSPGLSVAAAQGILAPGATTDLTVTLDAARIPSEGPFVGALTFLGPGSSKMVQVRSTVGRPPDILDFGEQCPPSPTCSRQIKLFTNSDPSPSPCNTAWIYSVLIRDMSRIQSAMVIARRTTGPSNADTVLGRSVGDTFTSAGMDPLGSGTTLRFAVVAVDQYGFGRRLADQTITCP